ncbi:uncharacterized protein PAC_01326 [Phialocephala subalpina]|uniref:Zn(2)-C6 fungal-type domain-containing protein n=1 Tax=Phialocephala subalpina TaxID=576137 RepID=A0A1L7WF97_9HELO|nr:uncharacterized protein PAC_01326 [Phialocephala subalpina]
MFFDFGPLTQDSSFQISSTSRSRVSAPRTGGVRVSLACVPCRSRHVKCGAGMPSCNRCVRDAKTCFYLPSRRAARDANTLRERTPIHEMGKEIGGHSRGLAPLTYDTGCSPSESYRSHTGLSSEVSGSPASSPSRNSPKDASPRRLLDLYYNFFHKAHPFVIPRYHFLSRLESDPDSLKYLSPVMQYIGSLYATDISSSKFREVVLNELDSPSLPSTGFTVLALLVAAIATHCEEEMERGRAILDRAIVMALELEMNSHTFASMETDPILAESWRRTYWGLYVTDGAFASIRHGPTFRLYTVEAKVELPCEECDYEGVIPRPRTLVEYERRDFEDEIPVFSSFTYLIDLASIAGAILGFGRLSNKELEDAVTNADAMLMSWKLHLPHEKQGIIDRKKKWTSLLIYTHRPLSRLDYFPIEKINQWVPLPVASNINSSRNTTDWLHTKKALEAAEAAANLIALPCHILQHTPLSICGLALATFTNMSACAYILSGSQWYDTRNRVRLGLGGLKAFGEVWAASRRSEREAKEIARGVFVLKWPEMRDETVGGFDFTFGSQGERLRY